MASLIDIDVLRGILASAERMVEYYGRSSQKLAQNAVLVAAGMAPLHSENSLKWDVDQKAEKLREAECLRAVIAYHTGGIYVPGETEEAA